jgi:hypothetical protein
MSGRAGYGSEGIVEPAGKVPRTGPTPFRKTNLNVVKKQRVAEVKYSTSPKRFESIMKPAVAQPPFGE